MRPAKALRHCALVVSVATLPFATAQAADAPKFAWGKAGVSYDQYRNEAYDCAMFGFETDISSTKPVEALRDASRQMDAIETRRSGTNMVDPIGSGISYAQDVQAIRESARPEKQVKEVKQILFSAMQQCMIQRGYTRFALTEDQRSEIDKLKEGSQERRTYLYKLASDPAVLERQKHPLGSR